MMRLANRFLKSSWKSRFLSRFLLSTYRIYGILNIYNQYKNRNEWFDFLWQVIFVEVEINFLLFETNRKWNNFEQILWEIYIDVYPTYGSSVTEPWFNSGI